MRGGWVGSMHGGGYAWQGWGACMAGEHAWQGDMCGREGVNGRGCSWQEGVHSRGACMAGGLPPLPCMPLFTMHAPPLPRMTPLCHAHTLPHTCPLPLTTHAPPGHACPPLLTESQTGVKT